MKRFRAEGDFLLRALTDFISQCRGQIHRLGQDFEVLENLAGEHELPRDVRQTIHYMSRRQRALGLSETQLRGAAESNARVTHPGEHRVQTDLTSDQ